MIDKYIFSFLDYFSNSSFFAARLSLGIRIILLTTPNASSEVAMLRSKMKQTIWLVKLLWRAEFSTYIARRVIGWSGGKEFCSNVSSRLWGGALRDETKNGCEGDWPLPAFPHLGEHEKKPFDVIYYLYKMKQFHWLLCVAKNCDWSRKITPLSNLTRVSLPVERKLTRKKNWTVRNLKIFKKILGKSIQFLSSEQPCELISISIFWYYHDISNIKPLHS